MKIKLSVLPLLCLLSGCMSFAQNSVGEISGREKPNRAPLKRSNAVLEAPKKYEMRETEKGTYDPKPRVVTVDEKAGKYELRWIGYDRKEKVISYQRHDALDAYVEATVARDGESFVYKYLIKNLPTSPSHFGSFKVQTFTSDVRDERIPAGEDLYIGHMSRHIPQFSEGVWRGFSPLGEANWIKPGMNREFQVPSKSPPGVVKCYGRAGEPTLKGVGEHMPYELEKAMPGFEEFASCITIGPVERLTGLSPSERAGYFRENLPKFVEAGWMAGNTPQIYEKIVIEKGLAALLTQARSDLAEGFITSEVFYIIEGLNQ